MTFSSPADCCSASGLVDNSINGQPNCGNRHLLTEILREEWGFEGHVVSDCGGVDHIWTEHHAVNDASARNDRKTFQGLINAPDLLTESGWVWVQEAVSAALHAGCDADCGHDYQQGIPPMVANGTIDMQLVDKAVVRVLTNRMMLGELEVLREFTRFLWKSRLKFARACHHLPSSSRRQSRLLEQDGTPKLPGRDR